MLAESLVAAPIVSFLINKLASKIWLELGLLWGVDTNRLHTRLSTIKAILDGAAARAIPPSAAVDKWLNDLKDAAYDADDVLDEYHSEALRRKKEDKVSRFFNDTVTFQFRYQMNKKMGDVMKKLDGIAEDRGWLQMAEQFDTPTLLFNQSRETFSAVNEAQVFGRDGDRMKLVDYLINKDNHNKVSILSIVGLGGIGKTTLAKLVYNDITKHLTFRRSGSGFPRTSASNGS